MNPKGGWTDGLPGKSGVKPMDVTCIQPVYYSVRSFDNHVISKLIIIIIMGNPNLIQSKYFILSLILFDSVFLYLVLFIIASYRGKRPIGTPILHKNGLQPFCNENYFIRQKINFL